MHGFGRVPVEADEPLFHHAWEGRVWAMTHVVMAHTTTDRFRFTIEQMPPASYLASSYYERWLWATERLAAEQGLLDGPARPPAQLRPPPTTPASSGRFRAGQRVRVRNPVTSGHTRVPRYLRRHEGAVVRVACAWPSPAASAATGAYGELELVYTVAFAGADLFGNEADHTVTADLGESDLEEA
jgi:nitrile hydratase